VVATVERYEREKRWDTFEEDCGREYARNMNEAEAVRKTARRILQAEPSLRRRGEDDEELLARIAKDIRNMLVAANKHRDHVPRLERDPRSVRAVRAALAKG